MSDNVMEGFAAEYADPPAYILGITKQIWEDRGVDSLRDLYADDVVVRSPAGVVVGNEPVIGATLSTLAEFGDRQLLGEDVIWSADPDGGFLSSHRIMSLATHGGDGAYGPASHTQLRYRVIADCAARHNQIYDEWLIRDQGAVVRQLGVDPKTFAADQIAQEDGIDQAARPLSPATDHANRYRGLGNDSVWAQRYSELLEGIMAGALGEIAKRYDRAVHASLPGGRSAHGTAGLDAFWLALRSAFPSAEFKIHHRIGREDALMPPRAALRWSLHGRHDGWGMFGNPSGADVYVIGISHVEFGAAGIRREYVLIDETAIWKQILLHSG